MDQVFFVVEGEVLQSFVLGELLGFGDFCWVVVVDVVVDEVEDEVVDLFENVLV